MMNFAVGQESKASVATSASSNTKTVPTPTPAKTSDKEIQKTLMRSLERNEAQDAVIAAKNAELLAKDEVIDAQEKLQADTEAAKEQYKSAAESFRDALIAEKKVSLSEREQRAIETKRVKELEKALRKSKSRVKIAFIGAIAGSVLTLFLVK